MLRKSHSDRFILDKSNSFNNIVANTDGSACDTYEKFLYREMIVNQHQGNKGSFDSHIF